MIDEAGSTESGMEISDTPDGDTVEQPTISNEDAAVVASAAVVSAAAIMDKEEKASYSMEPEDKTTCLASMTSMGGSTCYPAMMIASTS
jgi:hypothetical protein